jgi:flagellar hook assembly protein FlgD
VTQVVFGHGVILVNIRTIGVSEEREVNEQKITFSLIGPNPFYSISKIKYFIPKSSHVELKIYNLTGELVKTLVDKGQKKGIYIVEWDGKDRSERFVPSGIYFIKLSGDKFPETKKLLLLR